VVTLDSTSSLKQTQEAIWKTLAQLPDPEIPAVTLVDLGILRSIALQQNEWVIVLTPTYSGCPATQLITQLVQEAVKSLDITNFKVEIQLSPAWTTDWMTAEGRRKLRDYGIAPPSHCLSENTVDPATLNNPQVLQFKAPSQGILCPRCDSKKTERISQFGSTPCKALYRCLSCREPFDYFKPF
jgi:ring-1,2-phenylacetyl-CoA epoxidase subunit PaaD